MAHEVFISYASPNKAAADAVCAGLERRSIRCWIAPRDIVPGLPWAESIIDAIEGRASCSCCSAKRPTSRSRCSARSNGPFTRTSLSSGAHRERDADANDGVLSSSSQHWFDAIQTPMEQHLDRMAQAVKAHLARKGTEAISFRRRPGRFTGFRRRRLRPLAASRRGAAAAPRRQRTAHRRQLRIDPGAGHRPVRQHRLRRSAQDARNLVAVRV